MKKGNLAATAAKKAQDTMAEKRAQQLKDQRAFDNYEIAL
jgi:Ran GTPase-activating protein (RanGAP) involved in mRNA processing and transport